MTDHKNDNSKKSLDALAKEAAPCWGTGDTGPKECHGDELCELHFHILNALLLAQRSGLEMAIEICEESAKKAVGGMRFNDAEKIRAKSQELEQRGEKA